MAWLQGSGFTDRSAFTAKGATTTGKVQLREFPGGHADDFFFACGYTFIATVTGTGKSTSR
jgi:hypothetical protein